MIAMAGITIVGIIVVIAVAWMFPQPDDKPCDPYEHQFKRDMESLNGRRENGAGMQ